MAKKVDLRTVPGATPSHDDNELLIDRGRLDEECEKQARLYKRASKSAVKLQLRLDEAESALEVTEADLELKIRDHPEMFNLKKVTEASVKSKLATLKEVIEAKYEVNQAKYNLGMAKAHVNALDQKKRMLEKMIDLWAADYFSEPRLDNEAIQGKVHNARKRKARGGEEDD